MTSEIEMTIDELVRKIEAIKEIGWIRTARKGPTGVGHTFEGLLGYAENNISISDWGFFEIKTTRRDQRNLITLKTLVPTLVDGLTNKELIKQHGYWDWKKERQALYCSIDGVKANSLGWIMRMDALRTRIEFFHDAILVGYQELEPLKETIAQKIGNLVLVLAESKKEHGVEYFHYTEAFLLTEIEENNIANLIQNGSIVFDWRMHLRSNGTVRDHGPGYRMFDRDLMNLYNQKQQLV